MSTDLRRRLQRIDPEPVEVGFDDDAAARILARAMGRPAPAGLAGPPESSRVPDPNGRDSGDDVPASDDAPAVGALEEESGTVLPLRRDGWHRRVLLAVAAGLLPALVAAGAFLLTRAPEGESPAVPASTPTGTPTSSVSSPPTTTEPATRTSPSAVVTPPTPRPPAVTERTAPLPATPAPGSAASPKPSASTRLPHSGEIQGCYVAPQNYTQEFCDAVRRGAVPVN